MNNSKNDGHVKQPLELYNWRKLIMKYAPKNPTYRHVLITLSMYMNSAGESCFPTVETLANDTALSKRSIIRYLKEAESDGWIVKSLHGYSGQGWKRNEYTASVPKKVVTEVHRVTVKGGEPVSKGGEPVSKGGDTESPNLSINYPSNYPKKESTKESAYPFEEFWEDYDKKRDRKKSEQKYKRVSETDRKLIRDFIRLYKKHEPNPRYRKNPTTFLNQETWKDDWAEYKPKKEQRHDTQKLGRADKFLRKGAGIVSGFPSDS